MTDTVKGALIGVIGTLLAIPITIFCTRSCAISTVSVTPLQMTLGMSATKHERIIQKPQSLHSSLRFSASIHSRPQTAQLTVEVADLDLIGADVLLNDVAIGTLSVGDSWHQDSFRIDSQQLKIGRNEISFSTHSWSHNQTEDFLIRRVMIHTTEK